MFKRDQVVTGIAEVFMDPVEQRRNLPVGALTMMQCDFSIILNHALDAVG